MPRVLESQISMLDDRIWILWLAGWVGDTLEPGTILNGLRSNMPHQRIAVEEIGAGFLDKARCREVVEQTSLWYVQSAHCLPSCEGKQDEKRIKAWKIRHSLNKACSAPVSSANLALPTALSGS